MTIVEELRQNRESGARRLVAEYKAGLMTLARRFYADPGDAEELVNATFAAVVDSIDNYLEQSAFFGWMCQILTNIYTMDVRRKSNQTVSCPGVVPDCPDYAAQEAIYDNLDAALLRKAIDTLPRDQREAIALHYFMDMPVAQIAKYLSVPNGTVLSRLHYARKALAAKLGAAARKPGIKALLIAVALAALTAAGAATSLAVVRLLSPPATAQEQQAYNSKGAAAQEQPADDSKQGAPSDGLDPSVPDSLQPLDLQPFLFTNPSFQGETMNAKTLRSLAAPFAAALALATPATAKTIALWPMELDPQTSVFNGSNAVSSANALSLTEGSSTTGPDWALPSNPDPSGMLVPPTNGGTAVAGSRSGATKRYTMEATGTFGDRLTNTNEFTVEGWVKFAPNPSQTADYGYGKAWTVILQSGSGSFAGKGGWILSWRGDQGARKFWLTVPSDNSGANGYDAAIGPAPLSSSFEESMASSWHHLALTHKAEGGQDVWQLFIDGDNTIDGTEATVRKNKSGAFTFGSYRNLYFGGRPDSDNRINASFDYWRVSDTALEPSEFLCAEAATPGGGESRVAYLAPEGGTHSQWISTGVSLKGDARKTCTVEIWAYPLSGSSINQQFIEQFSGGNGRMNFGRQVSDGKLRIWMGDYSGAELLSSSILPLDTWSHVAWVADGDTWRLYINGELDAESTGHADHLLDASSADGFVIGNTRSANPNGQSNAYFAEARVWKCARTGAEIKATMNKRIENAWNVPDLIGYWPLDDGPADYALNGNRARNHAVLDSTAFTPSGASSWNFSYAGGNRVGWVSSALPVTGELHGERSAICGTGIHTNAVDTGVSDTPEAFTVMGWYLVNSSRANLNNYLCAKTQNGNGRMQFNEVNGALRFWMGGGSDGKTNEEFVVANCMPIGQWTHVALAKNANMVRIFVNGELVGENTAFTMGLCNANLHLGGFDAGGSRGGFCGAFRNVGFWSRAMGAERIRDYMYALPDSGDEKLLGYWPLDDGEGDVVRNLKSGVGDGDPVGNGFFLWTKGANMPWIEGTVKPSAFVITVR